MTPTRKAESRSQAHKRTSDLVNGRRPLNSIMTTLLEDYFDDLNGYKPANLYHMVIQEVEEPLLKTVMDYSGGNQTQAAQILGINRSTLRKKLTQYGLER